jgi:bacterioferritin-associated ferredoxin
MSYVYSSLGCAAKCGRCAHTIKIMVEEIKHFAPTYNLAIDAGKVYGTA